MGNKPPRIHLDSVGKTIEVGDTVCILSTGLYTGNTAVVTKIGKAQVSLKLKSGRSTNRKSTNLRVVTANV